jgi:hypothetical protein
MKRAGLKPLEPYQNSKEPWRCIHIKCGKEVSPTYNAIHRGQGGCGYCARKKIDPLDAKKLFISKGLKPIEPYQGNKHPWKSIHIPCGNEVSPTYNIIQRGDSMGCRFCSDQFVDPDKAFHFFLSKHFQPLVPYPGSNKPWKSIHLVCGNEASPSYGKIKSGRKGCLFCSGLSKISQERAVSFFRSKGLEPEGKFPGPNKGWKSIHKECGRKVSPRWASVQQGNGVCVYCSGKKVDLKEVKVLLKKLNLKPMVPYPGGKTPWKCIHLTCGNEVSPRYNAISRGHGPCIHCAGMVVNKSDARNLFLNVGLKPLIPYPGAGKPWPSIHKSCGNKVSPTYSHIREGGKGCIYCAGIAPITEQEAIKLFTKYGFTPLVKFPGGKKPWKVKHNVCGKTVSPTYGSIRRGGGCKYCQIGGINLLAPAYFYLITNKSLNSHKVGIGGFDSSINRLDQHKKQGWVLYDRIDFDTAEEAYEVEQSILDWLRTEMLLPLYLFAEQMPQRGHTETVDASEIALSTIWAEVLKRSKVKR